MFEIAMTS